MNPAEFPPNVPAKNSKKITEELLQERREKKVSTQLVGVRLSCCHLSELLSTTQAQVQNWNGYILFMLPVTFVTFVMARKTRPKAHDILSPRSQGNKRESLGAPQLA